MTERNSDEKQAPPGQIAEQVHTIPFLEKVVALSGMLLVVFVLGLTAYEAATIDDRPPEIHLRATRVIAEKTGYLVLFQARNSGSRATTDLWIEGRLPDEERRQVLFDYIPANSTREGGLFFTKKPDGLELRALGYQAP